jgi:hypothetical protein
MTDLRERARKAGQAAARDYIERGEEDPPSLFALPPAGPGPVSLTRVLKHQMGATEDPSREELAIVHEAWSEGVRSQWNLP